MTTKPTTKPVGKQALYSMVSSHAREVINRLVELSQSKNENIALGACKILLNKTLPDIKSIEVTDANYLDRQIEEEGKRYTANEPVDKKEMTEEECQDYGKRLIAVGEALTGTGRYAKRQVGNGVMITD